MNMLWVFVVDAGFHPVTGVDLRATTDDQRTVKLQVEEDRWVGHFPPGARVTIFASAEGYEPEAHRVVLRDQLTQVVIGLRQQGQLAYTYGNDRRAFAPVEDAFLIRVSGPKAADTFARVAKKQDLAWKPVSEQAAGAPDELFARVSGDLERAARLSRELFRGELTAEIALLIDHGDRPAFGLTNELVVRFNDDVRRTEAERIAGSLGLTIVRELRHAGNAFVLLRQGAPSYDLLKAADALAQSGRVVYVEPNLIFVLELDAYTPNDPLWAQVPYLQLINVDDAWDLLDNVAVNLRGGSPAIAIAVIDVHGVAPNHPDLTANLTDGTSKLITSMNFLATPIAVQTAATLAGDHGTQCAGSATAAFDENRGLPGVAPNCHLIGVRLNQAVTAVQMADVYMWVAGFLNGSTAAGFPAAPPAQPADVISTSYGSNGAPLANTVRDCFDFLTTYGRGGKGCVLCFSLGNNGYIDYTNPAGTSFRAWPTYAKTIGVGSSISAGPTNPIPVSSQPDPNGNTNNIAVAVDTRSLFSPFGATALRKPDLVSPSHTAYNAGGLIDPILSAVQVGTGAVDGCPGPAVCNDYAATFGGTSHSTPTVAGAVALILSARPGLNWVQVRDILRQSCVRIDAAQANAIGQWQDLDGDGLIDYSRWYGAGRLDVNAAVALALDPSLPLADIYVRENLADSGAVPSGGAFWASPDIWVRQNPATPIPALAWTDPPPHENARRMQDNAVFCRVRNSGTAAASAVYVRAMITHWAGLEFVYPADFQPSNNVGAPVPNPLVPGTYLIGETRIDNLGPGADQIVKFTWPQALVPPASVVVGPATVLWHPCLLLEASPHDGPTPIGGLSVPVQGNNNIAQRNITIVDPADAEADNFVGMIAGTRDAVGVATLIVDASQLRGATSIRLHVADERAMRQLTAGVRRAAEEQFVPQRAGEEVHCAVVVEQRTRLRVGCDGCAVVIEVAPGSRIITGGHGPTVPVTTGVVRHHGLEAVELTGLRGQIEIPLRLSSGQFVPVLVAITGPAVGDLRIAQRRGDGEVSAGYGIQRRSS